MADIHKNNVLHRDLKPENIFIDKKEGQKTSISAKIGDFGLARMLTNINEDNLIAQGGLSNEESFSPPVVGRNPISPSPT